MPRPLYLSRLAGLGTRTDPDYHELPAHLRGLADAASSARGTYLALADACRQARAAGAWDAVEILDAAELASWNAWQEMERQGAELLATHTNAAAELHTGALGALVMAGGAA